MSDLERAAINLVVWRNKVPTPPRYAERLAEYEEALARAVTDRLTNGEWWTLTYSPGGWPEEVEE